MVLNERASSMDDTPRRVLHAYEPQNQDELPLGPGDLIQVFEAPKGGWWRGKIVSPGAKHGQDGWFPCAYLEPPPLKRLNGDPNTSTRQQNGTEQAGVVVAEKSHGPTSSPHQRGRKQRATGVFDYDPQNEDELTLRVGTTVSILEMPQGGWWKGQVGIKMGWFPCSHVQLNENEDSGGSKAIGGEPGQEKAGLSPAATDQAATDQAVTDQAAAGEAATGSDEDSGLNVAGATVAVGTDGDTAAVTDTGAQKIDKVKVQTQPASLDAAKPASIANQPCSPAERRRSAQVASRRGSAMESCAAAASHEEGAEPHGGMAELRKASVTSLMRSKRSELSANIAKELRVREGATNMLKALQSTKGKAAKDKRTKAAVEETLVTLSFCNARLQSLRLNLQQLNSKQHAAVRKSIWLQHGHAEDVRESIIDELSDAETDACIPLIALPYKEAETLDLKAPLAQCLSEHYQVDPADFADVLDSVQTLRESVEEHQRLDDSLDQHLTYFRQLSWLDDRFFVNHKNPGIVFSWYDSCNGQPSAQKSIALEKACVLFNSAVLCSHLAAAQDTDTPQGRDAARDYFVTSAGIFDHVAQNFLHAPTPDLSPPVLRMLKSLCLAQAQECLVWGLRKQREEELHSGEWATLSEMHQLLHEQLTSDLLREYVPPQWIAMAKAKAVLYESAADRCTGVEQLQTVSKTSRNSRIATWTGIARLARAKKRIEKALRVCDLRLKEFPAFKRLATEQLALAEAELAKHDMDILYEQHHDLAKMLACKGSSESIVSSVMPSSLADAGQDLFASLGPIHVFHSTAMLEPILHCTVSPDDQGFGFTLGGNAPVSVVEVHPESAADRAGLVRGAVLVAVNGENVRSHQHGQVVDIIRAQPDAVTLSVQVVREERLGAFFGEEDSTEAKAEATDGAAVVASRRKSSGQAGGPSRRASGFGAGLGGSSGAGFGTADFGLAGKRASASTAPASRRSSRNSIPGANRASVVRGHGPASMLDSMTLPSGAHYLGQEERQFRNPLYADDK